MCLLFNDGFDTQWKLVKLLGKKTGVNMTLTIELKDQLAEKAQRIAQKNGKTVTELVEELLQKQEENKPESIVDRINRLTAGFSLPADLDARKEYNEAMILKHA